MIEISDGFSSISAGSDCIESLVPEISRRALDDRTARSPTGARVTLDFWRQSALAPGQWVTVRYDFAADGTHREGTGIARAVRTVVRPGHAVVYHYRLSYWIKPAALAEFARGKLLNRVEDGEPRERQALLAG